MKRSKALTWCSLEKALITFNAAIHSAFSMRASCFRTFCSFNAFCAEILLKLEFCFCSLRTKLYCFLCFLFNLFLPYLIWERMLVIFRECDDEWSVIIAAGGKLLFWNSFDETLSSLVHVLLQWTRRKTCDSFEASIHLCLWLSRMFPWGLRIKRLTWAKV